MTLKQHQSTPGKYDQGINPRASLAEIPWRNGLTMGDRQWYLECEPDCSFEASSAEAAYLLVMATGGAKLHARCFEAYGQENDKERDAADRLMINMPGTYFALPLDWGSDLPEASEKKAETYEERIKAAGFPPLPKV